MNNLEYLWHVSSAKMFHPEYKERFIAEYIQLVFRITKLQTMLSKWEKNELSFEPTCPKELLEKQLAHMENYRDVLCERARIEGIELIRL